MSDLSTDKAPLLHRVPRALYAAAVVALVGFVVSVSFTHRVGVNGRVTECSYVDVAAFVWAALVAGLVVAGIAAERRKSYDRLRLEPALLVLLSAVLLAVAVVHVLRGFGTVGGACG